MKEHPILMNGAMVRATLAGTKSQTRRIVKLQELSGSYFEGGAAGVEFDGFRIPREGGAAPAQFSAEAVGGGAYMSEEIYCPYGEPGDRLWVRETWRTDATLDGRAPSDFAGWPVKYEADGAVLGHGAHFGNTDGKTRVSIHMPRWASRILLEITGVRVERLHDISDADIEAEGIDMVALAEAQERYDVIAKDGNASGRPTLRSAWRDLWESTGGDWDANPWLWIISFRRVTP